MDRIPARGPAVLVVNHPNAMVDAMVVALVCPRRILFTGRATLFKNSLLAALLRSAGVVPLIRQKDVAEMGATTDVTRNVGAFDALTGALARGGVAMIFPEGVTGDRPQLAPLKTGAARIAFQARDAGVRGLMIVPVGLTFERKDAPRTRVFVQAGDPIAVDAWPRSDPESAARSLTAEIDRRLRAVTLNFESTDALERDRALSALIARLFRGTQATPEVWQPHVSLADEVVIARRVEEARARLDSSSADVRARADALLARLTRFREELRANRMSVEDLEISLGVREGTWFVIREAAVAAVAGPVALWGWLNHLVPFNLARVVAMRSIESGADPAMRTILYGIGTVLLAYAAQGALVFATLGAWPGTLYVASLPLAAEVNFHMRPRLSRVLRRARTYLRLRGDPGLRDRLASELNWLRDETLAIQERLIPQRTAGVGQT